MPTDANAIRIAEVYRLHLGGLSLSEIADQILVDMGQSVTQEDVADDLAIIERWQSEYQDPDKVRTSISLDLDSLFKSIMSEIKGAWVSRQANAKALFYKEARETLLQKALLYGLNTQNVNVSQKTKMWTILQELRADATQLETEANYPAIAEPNHLSFAVAAPTGLLVESDPGDGR